MKKQRLPDLLTLKTSLNAYSIEQAFESKFQGYKVRSDLDLKLLQGIFEQHDSPKTNSMYASRPPPLSFGKPQLSKWKDEKSYYS